MLTTRAAGSDERPLELIRRNHQPRPHMQIVTHEITLFAVSLMSPSAHAWHAAAVAYLRARFKPVLRANV